MGSVPQRKWRRTPQIGQNGALVRALRARLLAWYRSHKRDLPWRSDPEPFRVWISEIMLQQTRMRTVLLYYERFLGRFPDLGSLAAAEEDEVVELWAGLGYYRRARDLWRAARTIVERSGGKFPRSLAEIAQLPGVGRYTASAIYSIAFNGPEPVVDGNVRRVIGRVHGLRDAPESLYWSEAGAWLSKRRPGDFNQALMELGALVCTPAQPACTSCPLRRMCKSAGKKLTSSKSAPATESVELVILVVRHKVKVLLARQTFPSFVPGTWILPFRKSTAGATPVQAADAFARSIFPFPPQFAYSGAVRHAITRRRILAHVVCGTVSTRPSVPDKEQYLWADESQVLARVTSSLFHKALKLTPGNAD